MSIAALNQVYDEVRRLSIAGSDLAANDFRLKKLIAPLEKSAAKAPVFGKVAEAAQKVLDSTPKNSAEALLELGSLVTAILYTQGATGVEGDFQPLETTDLGLTASSTSARVLKPLIDALTTTGPGRLELIRDAHQRGAFKDLRLVQHAIRAIDDPYGEIGVYVARHVLPIYGKAIQPQLRESFRVDGKGGHARRLTLLNSVDPAATRELVVNALEEGSKEVKLAAIQCLAGREDGIELLLDQVRAKSKEVRAAAYRALAPIDAPHVVPALLEAVSGKHAELVAPYAGRNPSPELAARVVQEARAELEWLLNPPKQKQKPATQAPGKGKPPKQAATKTSEADERVPRLNALLTGITGRTDADAEALLLALVEQREPVSKVRTSGYVHGDNLVGTAASALLLSRSSAGLKLLASLGADVAPHLVRYSLIATALTKKPEAVLKTFGEAYLARPEGKAKAAGVTRERGQVIGHALLTIARGRGADALPSEDEDEHAYDNEEDWPVEDVVGATMAELVKTVQLHPTWLEHAMRVGDLDLVLALAGSPISNRVADYLASEVRNIGTGNYREYYRVSQALRGLIGAGHEHAVPVFLELLKHHVKRQNRWEVYFVFRMIPELPASAVESLKAMIPSVHEKLVDDFVDQVAEHESRHAS